MHLKLWIGVQKLSHSGISLRFEPAFGLLVEVWTRFQISDPGICYCMQLVFLLVLSTVWCHRIAEACLVNWPEECQTTGRMRVAKIEIWQSPFCMKITHSRGHLQLSEQSVSKNIWIFPCLLNISLIVNTFMIYWVHFQNFRIEQIVTRQLQIDKILTSVHSFQAYLFGLNRFVKKSCCLSFNKSHNGSRDTITSSLVKSVFCVEWYGGQAAMSRVWFSHQ